VDSITGFSVEIEAANGSISPVLVEPFSWVASLRCVLEWIQRRSVGPASMSANLRVEDGTVVTTFRIMGHFSGDLTDLESSKSLLQARRPSSWEKQCEETGVSCGPGLTVIPWR